MAARIAVEDSEFWDHLTEHIGFLRVSSELFDRGEVAEYKRLATSLRVLFHDNPPRGRAVLGHLGVLDTWLFLDTGGYGGAAQMMPEFGPVWLGITKHADGTASTAYAPQLSESTDPRFPGDILQALQRVDVSARDKGWYPFLTWWNGPCVRDVDGHVFSRWDLVRVASNQDGGAHVDAEVDAFYRNLARGGALGLIVIGGDSDGEIDLANPVPALIRQIAHEAVLSIERYAPTMR